MTRKRGEEGGLVRAGDLDFLKETSRAIAPLERRETPDKTPLSPEYDNPQMNLFQEFICNTDEERERLSNVVELWDSIPRYSINRQAMTRARENEKFLDNISLSCQHRGQTYTCTISPARITDIDGKQRDYYPSAREELVEDALRKLAADQHMGFFDKPNYRSGVVFSAYALREEMSRLGHAMSYQELRQSLDIMTGSIIEITSRDKEKGEVLVRSAYLPSLAAVSKSRLKDDPKAKWAAQFHPFVTGSIDQVTYRQFNYRLMMSHPDQLTRWLHKQLSVKYTFADYSKPFEMRYSTAKRDSGLLGRYARERDAVEALEHSFKDLVKSGMLSSCERKNQLGPRKKLLDAVFKIWPSQDFIREVKAANKRLLVHRGENPVGLSRGSR